MKYFILVIFVLVFGELLLIYSSVFCSVYGIFIDSSDESMMILYDISLSLYAIDTMMKQCCIFLCFGNSNVYYQQICWCCNLCCHRCFAKIAENLVLKENELDQLFLDSLDIFDINIISKHSVSSSPDFTLDSESDNFLN